MADGTQKMGELDLIDSKENLDVDAILPVVKYGDSTSVLSKIPIINFFYYIFAHYQFQSYVNQVAHEGVPIASETVAGIIKVGEGLGIKEDGTLYLDLDTVANIVSEDREYFITDENMEYNLASE